jgi:hypothetical protein
MNKKFTMLNDVGIEVNYTVLAITEWDKDEKYVIYTNFMPSDNELGYRLLVGKLVDEENFELKRVSLAKQKEVIDSFIFEMVSSGKKINR